MGGERNAEESYLTTEAGLEIWLANQYKGAWKWGVIGGSSSMLWRKGERKKLTRRTQVAQHKGRSGERQ